MLDIQFMASIWGWYGLIRDHILSATATESGQQPQPLPQRQLGAKYTTAQQVVARSCWVRSWQATSVGLRQDGVPGDGHVGAIALGHLEHARPGHVAGDGRLHCSRVPHHPREVARQRVRPTNATQPLMSLVHFNKSSMNCRKDPCIIICDKYGPCNHCHIWFCSTAVELTPPHSGHSMGLSAVKFVILAVKA